MCRQVWRKWNVKCTEHNLYRLLHFPRLSINKIKKQIAQVVVLSVLVYLFDICVDYLVFLFSNKGHVRGHVNDCRDSLCVGFVFCITIIVIYATREIQGLNKILAQSFVFWWRKCILSTQEINTNSKTTKKKLHTGPNFLDSNLSKLHLWHCGNNFFHSTFN